MGFLKQTWTLTSKNVLIVLGRHWLSTSVRAFIAPVIFMFFISYAKNFFIPPSDFGIGSPTPVKTLQQAFDAGTSNRRTVAFVNNGFTDGDIARVIDEVAQDVRAAGKMTEIMGTQDELLAACPSSLRGVTNCFAAVTFYSSPTQGDSGKWNYTLHGDGALGTKIYVNQNDNDAEIYVLPVQKVVDMAIASGGGSTPVINTNEYPYTQENNEQRSRQITRLYQGTLIHILSLAYFIGIVGVTYQLVGQMATERELGMSQLIEAMMPNKRRWEPQVARILANHLSFDIIYFPSWIVMGVIVAVLVFPDSNVGIMIGLHVLAGFSLTSYSILFGSFFRKAQLSGITAVIVSLVLAIIAQLGVGPNASTGAVATLSFFFPPMTYTFFMILTASFQRQNIPASLTAYPPERPWQLSGIVLYVFFIVQIIVFPVLGALVERSLYGTASTDRKVIHSEDVLPVSVRLSNFTKYFGPGWFSRNFLRYKRGASNSIVKAVDDVSLEIRQGQIMVLLGANGSGKSTTLDAISGLSKITSGEIEVDGHGGLGLCPQKNVLWDELTVYEHVKIFNGLKTTGRKATKHESEELVDACDLQVKLHAKSKTLSGGQKRKLQLAMMFTGGSRVCLVDEVSSGIDPLARRKVWDILLAERGKRTILLTTHFLDEADVLSDHIAVLSKGTLRADGSAVELKHRFGSGYHVYIEDSAPALDASFNSITRYHDYDQTVYQLPNSTETSAFITHLDANDIPYRVQGPTVEDVFLRLAEEIREDFGGTPGTSSPRSSGSEEISKTAVAAAVAPLNREKPMDLLDGQGTSLLGQAWILFWKRFIVLRHNYLPYLALVLIPIAAAGLVTLFLKGQNRLSCNPADQSSNTYPDTAAITALYNLSTEVVLGPSSLINRAELIRLNQGFSHANFHIVDTLADFETFIDNNYAIIDPGGFFINTTGGPSTFAYQAAYSVAQSVFVQNVLDNVLTGTQIGTLFEPFAVPFAPKAGNTLQVILYFGLAMSAYVGFFALYPTSERLRKVRALHYSNGVRSGPLWIAYAAFDFVFVLIVSVVSIALWVSQWYGWYYPGYLFVVFFLFGLTSLAYSYAISLFVSSQLAAFAFAAGSQAALFLLYFISYLSIITYAPVTLIDDWVTIAHFTIALITPSGNLLRALLLTLNEFSLLCDGRAVRAYGGSILAFGGPILYLLVQFFLLMAFVIWWDSGGRLVLFKRASRHLKDAELVEHQDPEVFEELSRIQSSNDGLRVLHLNKAFGTNLAVDDVTFGIGKGETFALLGPNGAGKSTTISLIRGDIRPSFNESEVFVESKSMTKHRVAARNELGVVPQFDAMDTMTVINHLRFYARARGVPNSEHNVQEVIRAVGLSMYANRMALKLSGGNKRKLSLAIALMGNPSVLLLDEPSSGMDAAAKRVMWRVLGSITDGRSLLITTHSMEEADALAQRAGIMAKRMLALGTTDTLRKRHGDAYYVHLVHREAPHTSDAEMERVKDWVRQHISGAILEDRTYHGQLRFSVPNAIVRITDKAALDSKSREAISAIPPTSRGISTLFSLLEANKDELKFAYYAVQPTTLDQVFLNVVKQHNVAEENYASQHAHDKVSLGRRVTSRVRKIIGDA